MNQQHLPEPAVRRREFVSAAAAALLTLVGTSLQGLADGPMDASAAAPSRPPTLDPTYGMKVKPPSPLQELQDPDKYLLRVPVPVKQVLSAEPSRGKIAGTDTLVGAGPARLLIQPPPPGTKEADAPAVMVDFGQELAGWVEVANASAGPIEIMLRYGESKGEALTVPSYITGDTGQPGPEQGLQKRTIPAGGVAKGVDRAFRYAVITVLSGPETGVVISSIRAILSCYLVAYRGSFDCSDPLLAKIWYTGAYEVHLCMQDVINDSPMYRGPWGGDLLVEGETINCAFHDPLLTEKTMDALRANAGDPATHQHGYINDIPSYSCAWVVLAAELLRHSGEKYYIRRHHDDLITLMDRFRGDLDERGLFANKQGGWDYIDWSPEFSAGGPDNVKSTRHSLSATHFCMIRMLREGAWLLEQIDDAAAASRYRQWANQSAQAAQKCLFDPATNEVPGNRWLDNALAIWSTAATPEQRKAIWEGILSRLYPENLPVSPYGGYYCIFAMSEAGHTREALDHIRWYWGSMLDRGCTTFPETYDPRQTIPEGSGWGGWGDRSHGWGSGPTSFLTERVLGVRPTGPGFETVTIQPDLGGLTWAKGVVPTPRGDIRVSYRLEGKRLTADIDVPHGLDATILLPNGKRHRCQGGRLQLEAALTQGN